MSNPFKSRIFRRCRTAFRWLRIILLFAVFLVVAAGTYLHLIGLPDFLKRPLLNHLRERGFEVQFTSARLGWGPDVVIENAAFYRPDHPLSPQLAAGRTQVFLNLSGLLRRRVRVDSLRISQGGLKLPFSAAIGDFLSVNDVSLDVDLLPNDTIRLQQGQATFHGIQIAIQGTVTNYVAARDWDLWAAAARLTNGTAGGGPAETENSLRRFANTLDKIHFTAPPQLSVNLGADGRDPNSLWTELMLAAGGAQTPWGGVKDLKLTAGCARPMIAGPDPFLKLRLSAGELTTPEVRGRNFYMTAGVARAPGSNFTAVVSLAISGGNSRWLAQGETNAIGAANARWEGQVTFHPSPLALVAATGNLLADRVQTTWGSAESVGLTGSVTAVEGSPAADASWGFWAKLNHWAVDWQADLGKVVSPKIQAARVQCSGGWRAPELVLTNLDVTLYGGHLTSGAKLDAGSRQLSVNTSFDFDTRQLAQLLPASAQDWMAQITTERPPQVSASIRLVLPSWTNRPPDGWAGVLPSLEMTGDFSIGPASFRHLSVDSAQSHFSYSNFVWNVPRLHAVRPEGDLYLDFTGSDQTGGFVFTLDSSLDPGFVRPLLPEKQQTLLDEVSFTKPPAIHAEIQGNWKDGVTTAVHSHLTATNFTAHGEKVEGLDATLDYTNGLLGVSDVLLFKDGGKLTAPWVKADLTTKRITTSNLFSTLDIEAVKRALGRITPGWLKAITFDTPPTIHLAGSFVPGDDDATDLHFAVAGQNGHYDRALADQISGLVNWTARNVAVTNVQADVYGGTMTGWGDFDYAVKEGTDFRGDFAFAKIKLPGLVRGWSDTTNHLEGVLHGGLSITAGNFSFIKSWQASGNVFISDARLWDIKAFGMLSPLLNAMVPGSGNSRAYQASADFVVTNAMLATDNLEIRSTGFRLLYRGTLNTDKQLDARAEALLLRDTPVFGHWLSWAFLPFSKLFEYKIGGTLNTPTYKPVYVPKVLLLMLRPFHTLKSFLPSEETPAPSDAPKTPGPKPS